MTRGNYGRKVGGAFLLLSILTAVAGSLGLLFSRTVLAVLRTVPAEGRPLVADLGELDMYLRQAVLISRALSTGDAASDIRDLRTELDDLKRSARSAIADLRRLVEDRSLSDEVATASRAHEDLLLRTQNLLDRQIDALGTRDLMDRTTSEWERNWSQIVRSMADLVNGLEAAAAEPDADPASMQEAMLAALDLQIAVVQSNSLQALLITSDARDLPLYSLRERLGEIEDRVGSLASLWHPSDPELVASPLPALLSTTAGLVLRSHELLLGEAGLLDLSARASLAERRVTEAEIAIDSDSEDVIASLEKILRISDRLSGIGIRPTLLSRIPTILTLTIVAAMAMSIVLTALFTRTFIRPVNELIEATKAVADGDLTRRAVVRSGDELEFLAKSMNRMVEQLSEWRDRMTKLNEELETTVSERTSDLRKEIQVRKEAEHASRESENRYRTIVEHFPRGVILLFDQTGRCLSAGGDAIHQLGVTSDKAVGCGITELLAPAEIGRILDMRDGDQSGKRSFEARFAGREWQGSLVTNSSGAGIALSTRTVILLDVTEEKENREKLAQSDKLSTLGTLVAGVAHEINNPNQAVIMAGRLLNRVWVPIDATLATHPRVRPDDLFGGVRFADLRRDMPRYIESIVNESRRIEHIVRSLKEYAIPAPRTGKTMVAINDIVRSAITKIPEFSVAGDTRRVVLDLSEALPRVHGDPLRLEQIVINLVQNAVQSLRDASGTVRLRSGFDPELHRIAVEVEDNGIGIPVEDIERITDPFFTTRRISGGAGLGLSISSAIAREYGGELRFVSAVNSGTTATLLMPACDDHESVEGES